MNEKILCAGTYVIDIFVNNISGVIAPNTGFKTTIEPHAGGNALNAAVAMACTGIPGKNIYCAGIMGDDVFSSMIEDRLKQNGINSMIRKAKGQSTAKCLIIGFMDRSRAFIGDRACNGLLGAAEIASVIKKVRPGIFYIGETCSLPNVDKKLDVVLRTAGAAGSITVVDYIISAAYSSKKVLTCGELIDVFHINDYEAGILTGEKDMKRALRKIMRRGMKLVVISRGHMPLLFGYKGKAYEMDTYKVKCVDGTGAGDAFTGGLINRLAAAKGKTFEEKIPTEKALFTALLFGQAAGAAAVTATGATAGVKKTFINKLVKNRGKVLLRAIKPLK